MQGDCPFLAIQSALQSSVVPDDQGATVSRTTGQTFQLSCPISGRQANSAHFISGSLLSNFPSSPKRSSFPNEPTGRDDSIKEAIFVDDILSPLPHVLSSILEDEDEQNDPEAAYVLPACIPHPRRGSFDSVGDIFSHHHSGHSLSTDERAPSLRGSFRSASHVGSTTGIDVCMDGASR